jgi:hypothetical protein
VTSVETCAAGASGALRYGRAHRADLFLSDVTVPSRILGFQDRYQQNTRPFEWKYTREDLSRFLAKLALDRAA